MTDLDAHWLGTEMSVIQNGWQWCRDGPFISAAEKALNI